MKLSSTLSLALILQSVSGAVDYDYIVLGGGTAGLTVASRLAKNKDTQVLVLEAGPMAEQFQEVFVPGLFSAGRSLTTLNWAYRTVPQVHLNDRVITVNAGKALGGSTVINAMIFPRGGKEQYDAWGRLNNDSSWTWDALLPFFKKSEIFTPPNAFQENNGATFLPDLHGFDGQVKVGFQNFFFEQSTLWRETSVNLGFAPSPDLSNGFPNAVGLSPNSLDASNNTRCSAACAYYLPFADQPNFTVITNATVARIIWAESQNNSIITAVAVEYLDATNQTQIVNLSKTGEVIVSAGTIGTPKILELSGVGNSTILKEVGVTPVLDLPTIGENLADHVHSWANAVTNASITMDVLQRNPDFAQQQLDQWFENRTGLYAADAWSLGLAAPSNIFTRQELNDLLANAEKNIHEFASQFSNGNSKLAKGIAAQHRIAIDLYRRNVNLPLEMNLVPGYSGPTPIQDRPDKNFATVGNVLYNPLSRGRTHISSVNPLSPPLVDPNYWAHPLDVAAHVAGIKLARKMLTTPPLGSIYVGEFEPGLDKQSNEAIEKWLRGNVTSDNHEVGSMAMLPKDIGGVVDTQLRIYGTKNVRVADASIIPFPISAHMSSSIYMIGERAAEIIKRK